MKSTSGGKRVFNGGDDTTHFSHTAGSQQSRRAGSRVLRKMNPNECFQISRKKKLRKKKDVFTAINIEWNTIENIRSFLNMEWIWWKQSTVRIYAWRNFIVRICNSTYFSCKCCKTKMYVIMQPMYNLFWNNILWWEINLQLHFTWVQRRKVYTVSSSKYLNKGLRVLVTFFPSVFIFNYSF